MTSDTAPSSAPGTTLTAGTLRHMYADVRARFARAALDGLSEEQRLGVPESSANPIVWAVGHCAHFYEAMVYRVLFPDAPPLHGPGTLLAGWDVEGAFDSFRAAHPDRWEGVGLAEVSPSGGYPNPDERGRGYRDRVTGLLEAALPASDDAVLSPAESYLHTYGIVHEHWHIEDWVQTRQTMGYPPPPAAPAESGPPREGLLLASIRLICPRRRRWRSWTCCRRQRRSTSRRSSGRSRRRRRRA